MSPKASASGTTFKPNNQKGKKMTKKKKRQKRARKKAKQDNSRKPVIIIATFPLFAELHAELQSAVLEAAITAESQYRNVLVDDGFPKRGTIYILATIHLASPLLSACPETRRLAVAAWPTREKNLRGNPHSFNICVLINFNLVEARHREDAPQTRSPLPRRGIFQELESPNLRFEGH